MFNLLCQSDLQDKFATVTLKGRAIRQKIIIQLMRDIKDKNRLIDGDFFFWSS